MKSSYLLTFVLLGMGAFAEPILVERQNSKTASATASSSPTPGTVTEGNPGGQPGGGNDQTPPQKPSGSGTGGLAAAGTNGASAASGSPTASASASKSSSYAQPTGVPMFGLCAALAVAVFA